MEPKITQIEVYDKRSLITGVMYVEQLSDNVFRTIENEIFNCRLTIGTEFETRVNKEGKHQIAKIIKDSDLVTRRFMLSPQFKESEYKMLGDEIVKNGGDWQVDFGGFVSVSLPKNCQLDLDELFRIFDFRPSEIKD